MRSKRKVMITGVALLVSLSLLLASATVVYSGGELRPLAAIFNRYCSTTGLCMEVRNTDPAGGEAGDALWGRTWGRGRIGVYGAAYDTNGQGVRGYANQPSGYGVYGYSYRYIGVRGYGASYGGYFTSGSHAVRAIASVASRYGVYASAYGTGGRGVYGYASGSSGHGVYGYSTTYTGVHGDGCPYGVTGRARCSSGRGVYGYTTASKGVGVGGYSSGSQGYGVHGFATNYRGDAVFGQATGTYGYAGRFLSNRFHGIFVNGSLTSGSSYDGYFYNCIRVGGAVYGSCASSSSSAALTSILALNDGDLALEPGDLVAFGGFVTSAEGSSESTLAVQKVNGANSPAIIGVVQSAYVQEAPLEMQSLPAGEIPAAVAGPQEEELPLPEAEVLEGEEPPPPLSQPEAIEIEPEVVPEPELDMSSVPQAEALGGDAGHFVEGAAQPGQYVAVVIQGITRVKVDASAAPVRVGDMLVASPAGFATAQLDVATARSREGVAEREISQGLVIGRALESLDTGTGAIYVFVSVR